MKLSIAVALGDPRNDCCQLHERVRTLNGAFLWVTTAYGAKEGLPMTNFLPVLLWRPSPNFSGRHGMRVDLIVLHDCEGGYEGPFDGSN